MLIDTENDKNKMVKLETKFFFDGLLDEDVRFASASVTTFMFNNNL